MGKNEGGSLSVYQPRKSTNFDSRYNYPQDILTTS